MLRVAKVVGANEYGRNHAGIGTQHIGELIAMAQAPEKVLCLIGGDGEH